MKVKLLVVLIIISGFGRDFLMVNINWIIKHLTQNSPNFAQSFFDPLLTWKVSNLILLKWILTLFFTYYFYFLTATIIRLSFGGKPVYITYARIFYLALILGAGLIYSIGYLTNSVNVIYTSTRTIMGIAQSFMPLMMIYLVIKFLVEPKAIKQ
ncbi:MAG: hypothetical protein ACWA41_00170 [Putridiphycobacter sp.]